MVFQALKKSLPGSKWFFKVFNKKLDKCNKIVFRSVHLALYQTSMVEIYFENSRKLLDINCHRYLTGYATVSACKINALNAKVVII